MTETAPATIERAAETLLSLLKGGELTNTIAELEYALDGQDGDASGAVASEAGITLDLLTATMAVRAELGRRASA